MTKPFKWIGILSLFASIILSLFLSSCGGNSGGSEQTSASGSWIDRFSTVDVAFFNNPIVEDSDGILRISGQGDPDGLYFFTTVIRENVYRVTVSGATEYGYTTLRIKFDDAEPIYVALDLMEGDFYFEFSDVTWIELLIFSDTAYRYALNALSIVQCDSCEHSSISNVRLKTRILAENPGLDITLQENTLRAAEILTDWVAQTVDHADSIGPVNLNTAVVEVAQPGWIQDNLWDNDMGGTFCQGFATYLDKVFSLFGIKSFVITIGYNQTNLTHVTTVVVTDDQNGKRFFMFDPTFNGAFTDLIDGSWVDLATLFEQYETLGMQEMKAAFEPHPILRTKFIRETAIDSFMTNLSISGATANCPETADEDGFFVCRDFTDGLPYFQFTFEEDLSQMNVDPSRVIESLLIEGGVISANWVDAEEDLIAFESLCAEYNLFW